MEITDDWVRGLTGWKPFKEGKAMADQGLVAGFKRSGNLFQGTLREGKLTLRPVVKVAGPSDVHVQCGCPDHRATGGVCAHAVAVLLTSLASPAAPSAGAPGPKKPASAPTAWDVRLSPRLEPEWLEGKLSARLLPSAGGAITPADVALSAWLADRGPAAGPQAFRLAGSEAADLLERLAGHPRIEIDGRAGPFRLESEPAPPLRLAESRLDGSRVTLELDPAESRRALVRWGHSPAHVAIDRAARLPAASARPGWLERALELARRGRLQLSVADFLADLDAWLDLFEAPHPGWLGSLRFAGSTPDFVLDLEGSLESLEATLSVRYPGLSARPLPDPGDDFPGLPAIAPDGHLQARQIDAEEAARRLLTVAGFEPAQRRARFQMRGRDAILAFVADDLPGLRQQWTVREGERFATVLQRVHVVRPEIEQKADFGSSLAFELSFQTTGGQRIPGPEMRRLLGGGKRRVTLKSGAELVLSRTCETLVQPLVSELGIGRPDEEIRLSGAAGILFQNLRDKLHNPLFSNTESDSPSVVPPAISHENLNATLRPYQSLGSAWLSDRLNRLGGALLADEMGLGKTIQTIASINHFKHTESLRGTPVLIIAPTSLLGNWLAELERFAPGLKCLGFHGAGRDRLRDQIDRVDVVVTSYGTLTRDLAFHLQREYRLVVADEASLLRNPDAETSKALAKLRAGGRIALTGTPIENRIQDLWAIFRFVAPGYLGDRKDFRERYETAEASTGLLERLRLRISPFVLRRTKEQVTKDLPDKLEIDEWLNLTDDQAALYASLARSGLDELERIREQQGEGASRIHLLTLLLRLRQTCVDPGLLEIPGQKNSNAVKIDRLLELLGERSENGSKTLVFSQFAKNLRRIESRLQSGFGRVFCLDGSTRNRQSLVDAFQSERGPAVFLISLKAGGYGLNLTAADAVVHLDPWWNPAVEAQATDRAHRIGQSRPVTVYRLLTRDTVEERVRRMQDKKRALIDAATGDDEAVPQNWTSNDLEALLK